VAPLIVGAPGIYTLPDEPIRALTGVRMDVCGFVGVAPRGPAQVPYFAADWAPQACDPERSRTRSVPIAVESWSEYTRIFGSFEGPALLPYAVASYFENGGQRAYVVRIVHDYGGVDPRPTAGVARGRLQGLFLTSGRPITLRARNEGSWGNLLSASLTVFAQPLAFDSSLAQLTNLALPLDADVPLGTLFRLTLADGTRAMRFVASLSTEWHPESRSSITRATFDQPLTASPVLAEVVDGTLEVDDHDGRTETLGSIAFSSSHPRWLARVLVNESTLLYPDDRPTEIWIDEDIAIPLTLGTFSVEPPPAPPPPPPIPVDRGKQFIGGEDRYPDLVPSDFFGDWVPGDECPGDGVTCLVDTPDVSSLCVPDLYSPEPLVPIVSVIEPPSVAGPNFAPCVAIPPPPPQEAPPADIDGLRLDPEADLDMIIGLQKQLVDFAEQASSFIVLLDVPPRLHQRQILAWRSHFASAFAATYHPWLKVALPDDPRQALIDVNPSAFAAGIIALKELTFGVPYGPANEIAQGAVDLIDRISPARHDQLHPHAINVFLKERDGVRLTAARTLSLDPSFRQLSVRRLITMLERVLEREMQWMVFEPNDAKLRGDVTNMLVAYLRQLYRANAFQGANEAQAFFVRCDDSLNPPQVVDAGQLLAQIGVAPTEPLEFIVLQIARQGDGTLRIGA
jgi:hypothetical protein